MARPRKSHKVAAFLLAIVIAILLPGQGIFIAAGIIAVYLICVITEPGTPDDLDDHLPH